MAQKGLRPDASVCRILARAATQAGRASRAQRLGEHAETAPRSGVSTTGTGAANDQQKAASLIKSYARERDLASAGAVFRQLQASSTQASSLIYNCYLDACVQCG